jgi:predicted  nucleic acid-binding Zn-ribbon protein
MTSLTDLIDLQETDLLLDKAEDRLAEIEAALVESGELLEARARLAEKQEILSGLRARQADAEQVVEDVRGKAADVEKKLYSGQVKNAKELQDLDADLRSIKELLGHREDEMLAELEQVEVAAAEAGQVEAEVQALESDWNASRAELQSEQQALLPQASELRATRDTQAAHIDRALLALYDNLRRRKGGQAVARLERGMCGGCRITLPTSTMQKIRGGGGIVQCVSCERILLT